jgi:hypothetical protein
LNVRPLRYELDECNRLVRMISTRFGKEPGVAQAMYSLLVRFGVIDPARMAGQGQPGASGAEGPGAEPLAAAAAPASPLWTPGSPAAAPASEAKSKLWLPGST